jgi:hypothetical protein
MSRHLAPLVLALRWQPPAAATALNAASDTAATFVKPRALCSEYGDTNDSASGSGAKSLQSDVIPSPANCPGANRVSEDLGSFPTDHRQHPTGAAISNSRSEERWFSHFSANSVVVSWDQQAVGLQWMVQGTAAPQ